MVRLTKSRKPTSPLTGLPGSPKTSAGGRSRPLGSDSEPERLTRLEPHLVENAADARAIPVPPEPDRAVRPIPLP